MEPDTVNSCCIAVLQTGEIRVYEYVYEYGWPPSFA